MWYFGGQHCARQLESELSLGRARFMCFDINDGFDLGGVVVNNHGLIDLLLMVVLVLMMSACDMPPHDEDEEAETSSDAGSDRDTDSDTAENPVV